MIHKIYVKLSSLNAKTNSNSLGKHVHFPDTFLNIVNALYTPEKITVIGSIKHSDTQDYHRPHLASRSLRAMVLNLEYVSELPQGTVKTQTAAPQPSLSTWLSDSVVLR